MCSVCSDNASFVLVNTLVTDERTRKKKRSEQDMLPFRANAIARYPFQCTDNAYIFALSIPQSNLSKVSLLFLPLSAESLPAHRSDTIPYHKLLDRPSRTFRVIKQGVVFKCSACLACQKIHTMGAKFTHRTLVRRPNAHPFSFIHIHGADLVRLRYEIQ